MNETVEKQAKPSKEELRKKLKDKMKGIQLKRSSKESKNNIINSYCAKSGIDRNMIDQLMKLQKKK